jgi:hypothetical protein
MSIEISQKKINELEDLAYKVYNGEEPLCVVCGFHCPYSSEKNGQCCDNENPFDTLCKTAFIKWLKEKI